MAEKLTVDFCSLFQQATGLLPYDYQDRLARDNPELLDIPTGAGKTAAVVLAWLWRRRFADEPVCQTTPRRLVYCLPMRVLVEQTHAETIRWLDRLGVLAGQAEWDDPDNKVRLKAYRPESGSITPVNGWAAANGHAGPRIAVHLLMGGEDAYQWDLHPECDAVLIGTQDMLLSRVLNRGYGMSRYRWPMHFGLLNNDCLWVMDEVQLMGDGAFTTVQLDGFRKHLWGPLQPFPCRTLWMSATVGTTMFETRDRQDWKLPTPKPFGLLNADREDERLKPRLQAAKHLQLIPTQPKPNTVLENHQKGRISLVIFNTVVAARHFYEELSKALRPAIKRKGVPNATRPSPELLLLHSRFRPADRCRQMNQLQEFLRRPKENGAVVDHPGLIVVSTQVVEAGVDLSAIRLWSEIAPWASDVQRLGRLNREGLQPGATAFFWMPKADAKNENKKDMPNAGRVGPYDKKDLDTARRLIEAVINGIEGGAEYRQALDEVLTGDQGKAALQIEAGALIRPDDLFELFSTEPDLAGGFTDISLFVRSQDRNLDSYVFWRDFVENAPAKDEPAPDRDELCPVAFYELRRFLDKNCAWEWDGETREWQQRRAFDVQAGMTLMLNQSLGGYAELLGWTGYAADKATLLPKQGQEPDSFQAERLSETRWETLAEHTAAVEAETRNILTTLDLEASPEGQTLLTAARWHDVGKAHPKWQEAVREYVRKVNEKSEKLLVSPSEQYQTIAQTLREQFTSPQREPCIWAKFPDVKWTWTQPNSNKKDRAVLKKLLNVPFRPALRHEAASALATWELWQRGHEALTPLCIYLIATHHGKVRTVLRSRRKGDNVAGIREGDVLPPLPTYFAEPLRLRIAAKRFGADGEWNEKGEFVMTSPSWVSVVSGLLGPNYTGVPEDCTSHETSNDALGVFALAYLEALLMAADGRASASSTAGEQ